MPRETSAFVPVRLEPRDRRLIETVVELDPATARELAEALYELESKTRLFALLSATMVGGIIAGAMFFVSPPLAIGAGSAVAGVAVRSSREQFLKLCESLGIARSVGGRLYFRWVRFEVTDAIDGGRVEWIDRCARRLVAV